MLGQLAGRGIFFSLGTAVGHHGRLADGHVAKPSDPPCTAAVLDVLDGLAALHDTTRSAIALAFVLRHPSNPIALLGTQSPDRLRAAVDALAVPLSRRSWYNIVEAYRGVPMP